MLEGRRATVIGDETLVVLARLAQQPGAVTDRAEALAAALAAAGLTAAVRWREAGSLATLAAAGAQAAVVREPEPEPLSRAVLGGEALIIDDLDAALSADRAWQDHLLEHGLRAAALLPLSAADQVAGWLALFSPEPTAWRETGRPRLQLLARLAADALSTPPADSPRGAGPPEALLREAFVVLHLDRDADELCRRAVQQTTRVLETDFALVARTDEARQQFTCFVPGERFELRTVDAPLLRQVASSKERLVELHAASRDVLSPRLAAADVKASLALPLEFQGENFGCWCWATRTAAG